MAVTSGNMPVTWLAPGSGYQPVGWQGPAQHTYTRACDGHHPPGPCPGQDAEDLSVGYSSGSVRVGADVTKVCAVPENGVLVKNRGPAEAWLGDTDIIAGPDGPGYPLEPSETQPFTGMKPKESPVVPAPAGDMDPAVLYARTADGGECEIYWISISMT